MPLLSDINSAHILNKRVKNSTDSVEDWTKYSFL